MDWLQLIALALVQGITEFLPISSSAHLVLPALLSDWPDQGLAFDVAVHVGTLTAVCAYYRKELTDLAGGGLGLIAGRGPSEASELLLKLAAATLPIAILGFLLKSWVETELRSVLVIALATIVFGLALWWADTQRGSGSKVSWLQALLIGAAQVLALIPGTSRSGITITAALLLGLSRSTAARFAFLLSIPTIAAAGLLYAIDLAQARAPAPWADLLIGCGLAGAAAFTCIHLFVTLVERTGMLPYVIYRLALGTVLLGMLAAGAA